jgi:LysR family transcriptional regulator, transcriptional activator of nhaA
MKTTGMNFRHLYYFWVVAKEGSVTRAAERLDLAIQTISTQLTLLEQSVGKALFTQQGRRLVLTEAGRLALVYADQIFLLGEQLQEALGESDSGRSRLTVGISDSLPKLTAFRLLEATMHLPTPVRLVCYEDEYESLLADLALHKLDVVLTDRATRSGTTLRLFSHLLFESDTIIAGAPALAGKYTEGFPKNLNGAPFLLPTRNNSLRGRIDAWFELHDLRPDVVGQHLRAARPGPVLRPRRAGGRSARTVRRAGSGPGAPGARTVFRHLERTQDQAPGGRGDFVVAAPGWAARRLTGTMLVSLSFR